MHHGDVHNKLRSVTNDWFKPAVVRHRQPTIESIADEFIDKMAAGRALRLRPDVAQPFTIRVIMSIFRVPRATSPHAVAHPGHLPAPAGSPEYLEDFDPLAAITVAINRFEEYFDAQRRAAR